MKTCSIILAEFAVDDFALRTVLLNELREAITEGEFDNFIVNHGRFYDDIALDCLKEIKKQFPHIQFAVAMPQKIYKIMQQQNSQMGKCLKKYYENIEVFTFDTSNVNYKFRLLQHYLQMAKLSSFMLFMLDPKDENSAEYFAWENASKKFGVDVYNIYNRIEKQPFSVEGLFARLSNEKLIQNRHKINN